MPPILPETGITDGDPNHVEAHHALHVLHNDWANGVELAHADKVNTSTETFSSTSDAFISGLEVTAEVGRRPIEVRFEVEFQQGTTNSVVPIWRVWEDDIVVATFNGPTTVYQFSPEYANRSLRRALAPGAHTFKLSLALNSSTNRSLSLVTGSRHSLSVLQR